VYIIGLAAMVLETGSLTLLMREGPFAMRVNMVVLALAILTSYLGALHFGLAGAALGSVSALFIDRSAMLWRMGQRSGVPFRAIQDWRGLALALVNGIVTALVVWGLVDLYFAEARPLMRLAAGGVLLAVAYVALPSLRSAARLKGAA
jgi:peptidoglycan biosynthesis protein MviN/MurJ (putative lipid II flippase)